MNDELHAARLVEEALEDQCVVRVGRAPRAARPAAEIAHELHGRGPFDADLVDQPAQRGFQEVLANVGAKNFRSEGDASAVAGGGVVGVVAEVGAVKSAEAA